MSANFGVVVMVAQGRWFVDKITKNIMNGLWLNLKMWWQSRLSCGLNLLTPIHGRVLRAIWSVLARSVRGSDKCGKKMNGFKKNNVEEGTNSLRFLLFESVCGTLAYSVEEKSCNMGGNFFFLKGDFSFLKGHFSFFKGSFMTNVMIFGVVLSKKSGLFRSLLLCMTKIQ